MSRSAVKWAIDRPYQEGQVCGIIQAMEHDVYYPPIQAIACPDLHSPRLLMRPFVLDDALALFSWASDPEVTRYLRFHLHEDVSESKRVISHWIEEMRTPPFFHWAIVHNQTGSVFGSIGLEVVNKKDCFGEVGYCIAKRMWNQGYTTEALKAVLEFGFRVAVFFRIQGCYSVCNPASGCVMHKAGMEVEAGPLRAWYRSDMLGFQDAYMAAAFADTWTGDTT